MVERLQLELAAKFATTEGGSPKVSGGQDSEDKSAGNDGPEDQEADEADEHSIASCEED